MGKVSTNNYDNAFAQAKAIEEAKALKAGTITRSIPKNIPVAEAKNHYHVLLVKNRHDAKNERYVATANVHTFSKGRAFDKISRNFKNQGFATAIIVHDPTQYKDTTTADLKQHEKSAIEVQIEQEEEEAKNKRIAERKAEAIKKAETEKAKQEEEEAKKAAKKQNAETGTEVNAQNVDALAKEFNVDVSKATTPEGKIALVNKAVNKK